MKILSTQTEVRALMSICSQNTKISSKLLADLTTSHFYYSPALRAYKRIIQILRETGGPPDWDTLLSDIGLSPKSREILAAAPVKPITSIKSVTGLIKTLEDYRKLRGIIDMSQSALDKLEEDAEKDLDAIIEAASDALLNVRTNKAAENSLAHLGKGNNSKSLIDEVLYGEQAPYVATGFGDFDSKNKGILLGSLFTLGANTGGGKTDMAINMMLSMARDSLADCAFVSLEMTKTQLMARILSVLTGIERHRVASKDLTSEEKAICSTEYKKFAKHLKDNNTRMTLFEPVSDVSIESILSTLRPYNYKVIFIDYISLLQAGGDEQWKELGKIARTAKVYANTTNSIVVMLCQVSDEGRIKYASAIAEHSNNSWVWVTPTDDSDLLVLDIKQIKARNQLRNPIRVQCETATGKMTDANDSSGNSTTSSQNLEDMNE